MSVYELPLLVRLEIVNGEPPYGHVTDIEVGIPEYTKVDVSFQ